MATLSHTLSLHSTFVFGTFMSVLGLGSTTTGLLQVS